MALRFPFCWRLAFPLAAGVMCSACRTPPVTAEMRGWLQRDVRHALDASELSVVRAAGGASEVQLAGMLNETLGFWLVIQAGEEPVLEPRLRVQALESMEGRIEASAVRLYRAHPVAVGRFPGWHVCSIPPTHGQHRPLDVLVPMHAPIGGLPEALDPHAVYTFWADVSIPKGIPEGRYRGSVELTAQDQALADIDIALTVWPVVLPDEAEIPVVGSLDHRALIAHQISAHGRPLRLSVDDWRQDPRGADIDALIHATVRMLHAHGVTAVLDRLAPIAKIGARGELMLDWTQYDATAGPIVSGELFFDRVPPPAWPVPPIDEILASTGASSPAGRRSSTAVREYLSASAGHFAKRGWLDRAYVEAALPNDGRIESRRRTATTTAAPVRGGEIARLAEAAARVHEATARLEHAVATSVWWFPQDLAPYGWADFEHRDLSGLVDIWVTPAQFFDPQVMRAERAQGRRTWLAVDRPPFSGSLAVHAPLTYVRILSWQGLGLGAEALHVGRINPWPEPAGVVDPEACVRANPTTLIYPGRPFGLQEPVPSLRLKMLRQSVQDAAYVRLLREHGLDHIAGTVIESLSPRAGAEVYRAHYADGRAVEWPDDIGVFDAARETMVMELIKKAYPKRRRDAQDRVERTVAWQRLLERGAIGVHVDGCRVRLGGSFSEQKAHIECTCSIVNRGRVPADATASFDEGALEWLRAGNSVGLAHVPPNAWRRVFLTAESDFIPAQREGCLGLPMAVRSAAGALGESQARVCCIAAVPRLRPIALDGDLSDWPADAANVASGFQWISGPAADDGAGPARTFVFVMSDPDFIYLAVRCASDADPSTLATRRNTVYYDDLVPEREELIEVLIDPLNAGTRSPADLYHIAVKPTGAAVWEKGIAFEPPVGRRAAWPADIEVATRPAADHWTVEMKIPRSAFGVADDRPQMWGFNVTRFDAARQEFSTWSGATGNAYDPLSLGNLYVPGQ